MAFKPRGDVKGQCLMCGKEFVLRNYNQHYCSEACEKEARAKRSKERYVKKQEVRKEYGKTETSVDETMKKTSERYCKYCVYYNKYIRCCDYFLITGKRRGCPVGWCNKKTTKTEAKKKESEQNG